MSFAQQVWLWLKEQRFDARFSDTRPHALDPRPKFPELHRGRAQLAPLRQVGPATLRSRDPFKPAHERIVRALALLLWKPVARTHPRLLARQQRELRTVAAAFLAFMHAYVRLRERAR